MILLAWFVVTVALGLAMWVRATILRARRPWIPPALVLIASFAALVLIAA